MFSHIGCGQWRVTAMLVVLALAVTGSTISLAHEGHEHGDKPAAAVSTSKPRVTARSETYELVGVLTGDRLTVYLDRFGSNEPVTGAKVGVSVEGDPEMAAENLSDGTYAISSTKFAGAGQLELVFNIVAPNGDDLLIGKLQLPTTMRAGAPAARTTVLQGLQKLPEMHVAGVEVGTPYVIAGVALVLGFVIGLAVRGRRRLVPLAGLGLIAILVSTGFALAHGGEDHGDEPGAASAPAGDAPQRLPDGALFVPKPSQRILDVRTTLARMETASRAVSLIARVIPDPNRSGLVQSINGGRVSAPEAGLPQLGQAVKKGDVLAVVEMPIIPADRATLAEKVGDIEQQIALAEARLARARRLVATGAGTAISVSDAEIEVEGLKRRREAVREVRSAPEILRAPVDGVIAAARVVAGQVVQAQDILFQVVDPKGLWVEATIFHESDMPALTGGSASSALTTDGARLQLTFKGTSRAMQQQATVVQFAVTDPPPTLNVGQPVTVVARAGVPERGVIFPREAVVRGANGEMLVWRHTDPERFEPRPVRIEAFDADRLVVRAGISEGERIVIRGAELINQIR